MADQVHGFARGVKTFNSMASAAATLVAGLGACRCASAAPAAEKPSWFRTIIKNAGLIEIVWSALWPSGRDQKE
jgi:hypothetical protein